MELPNDLGPMVAAMYCNRQEYIRIDNRVGTNNCTAPIDNDDDAILYTMTQTYHPHKCIGTVLGMSVIWERLKGPCPSSSSSSSAEHKEIILCPDWMQKNHHSLFGANAAAGGFL
eukprot:scaffold17873_cov169-Amphora_coffeaeformis.AAC.1